MQHEFSAVFPRVSGISQLLSHPFTLTCIFCPEDLSYGFLTVSVEKLDSAWKKQIGRPGFLRARGARPPARACSRERVCHSMDLVVFSKRSGISQLVGRERDHGSVDFSSIL